MRSVMPQSQLHPGLPLLAQLASVGGEEEARTALADWHDRVARGYEF